MVDRSDLFLADYGSGLTRMPGGEFDFRHELSGVRIELKSARRNQKGSFVFQYIRPDCFDLCVCLAWHEDAHHYWIFPTTEIQSFLTRQHRHMSFQLKIRAGVDRFRRFAVSPGRLRLQLDRKARTVARHRRLVRLDPILENMEGWPSVARSLSRQLKQCNLYDWQFVLRPLREQMSDPDELPYPELFEVERRIEFQVHPQLDMTVRLMAIVLFDVFDQYLECLERRDSDNQGDEDDGYPVCNPPEDR
jgi:hypothetical protein